MLRYIGDKEIRKPIIVETIAAYWDYISDRWNEEKFLMFKYLWNKAINEASTTEEMEILIHFIPTDHLNDFHSEGQKRIREKWDELDTKEITEAKDDLVALKHAYDHSPCDDCRMTALQALMNVIRDEKTARRLCKEYTPGSDFPRALEKKFPNLHLKNNKHVDESPNEGGMNDIEESDITDFIVEDDEDDLGISNNATERFPLRPKRKRWTKLRRFISKVIFGT